MQEAVAPSPVALGRIRAAIYLQNILASRYTCRKPDGGQMQSRRQGDTPAAVDAGTLPEYQTSADSRSIRASSPIDAGLAH